MRTDQKHESVIAQMKGERKASNVVSQSKAVGFSQVFFGRRKYEGVPKAPPHFAGAEPGNSREHVEREQRLTYNY
jgi:hypothetical protein